MSPLSRRSLLRGATLGTLLANLPPGVRLSFLNPAQSATAASSNVLIFCLLRGGMDGLNLVCPADDADLIAARPAELRLATSGTGAGLPLANGPSGNDWRLHPSALDLKTLYDAGELAFVHAAGVPADSRSHFEMLAMIELGVIDTAFATTGWIARYASGASFSNGTFAVVSVQPTPPNSLNGDAQAITLANPSQFTLGSADRTTFLQAAYATAPGVIGSQGRAAIAAVNTFSQANAAYTPPPSGTFDNNSFAAGLAMIAELIKLNIGLKVAEVEYSPGWDTHTNQDATFSSSVAGLSKGIGQFYNYIGGDANTVTMIAMSEFGRRVRSNSDLGTDHGHGGVMMVLGGGVNGGRIFGTWTGLADAALDLGDVPVNVDFRAVLGEVIASKRGDLPSGLFPGLAVTAPLGLFVGS
jgi:uncharacterized protein (DUF1501 family)